MNNKEKLLDFRLALIGCFLPEKKQSLHDILDESHMVGVKGKEDLTDFSAMDESVSPLEKDEIINNCGESLLDNFNKQSASLSDLARKKILSNQPFKYFSDKLLPLEEYICSRFIAASKDEVLQQKDDTNLSLMANEDDLNDFYNVTSHAGILSLPSVERLSAYSYGNDKYTLMNKKLFLGSSKFKLNLETTLKNNLYTYILKRLIEPYAGNNTIKSIIGSRTSIKIYNSLKKNSESLPILSSITGRGSCITYTNNKIAKFTADALSSSLDSYGESNKEEYFKRTIDSFCESTANEIVNKYLTQRLFDDIDILNFGLARYFQHSPKYTGYVYSGRFITDNDNFAQGQTYTLPSQISTSRNSRQAKSFIKDKTNTKKPSFWIINLKGHNAVDFSSVSPFPEEEEVLIPAGTKLKVDQIFNRKIDNGSKTIQDVTCICLTELEN